MNIELYKRAARARDLPPPGLRRGDVVTPVEPGRAPDGTEGFAIEVFNALGETIAVTCVSVTDLEALTEDEVLSIRRLKQAA